MAAVHPVVRLQVPDDRLDGLTSFEQPAFFIGQPLVFAPVFDLNGWVVFVHTPVAQVGVYHLGLDAHALHQDGALLDLFVHRVPVIWVTGKAPGTHDQIALERHGQTDLYPKLERVAALTLADAIHLWRVPAVELGAVTHRFAAGRLRDQAFGFVQGLAQGFLHGLAEGGHLASHLALQASNDGPLAFDDFAHALELASMGVTPSLVAQQVAFFGVGLFELDAMGFGLLNHFGAGRFQQLAVGGVGYGLLLHRGVHDHTGQFLLGDQLERDRHLHGAGKQFFHALLAQSFTKAPKLGGVARPLVLKILIARKVLPGGVSPQRWITSSSLSLNACLRYSRATIKRVGKRGRPALETPPPATTEIGPNKSRSSIFLPALTWRAQRWARDASISCQGMR